jgi:hypothetical protein
MLVESKRKHNLDKESFDLLTNFCSKELQINSHVVCQVMSATQIIESEPSWQFYHLNRALDHDRVERIAKQQEIKFLECKKFDFYFNPIVVCKYQKDQFLIDGQHRVATLKKLKAKFCNIFDNVNCIVLFITCENEQDIAYNFERVNSGTPLPASYYHKKISQVLKLYAKWLETKFQSAVSSSEKPRRPNFNVDLVKKEISLDEKFKIACGEGKITLDVLIKATEMQNDIAKELYESYEHKLLTSGIKSKISSSAFYLGKDKMNVWIHKIINQCIKIINTTT